MDSLLRLVLNEPLFYANNRILQAVLKAWGLIYYSPTFLRHRSGSIHSP